jgi:hypothetical protein
MSAHDGRVCGERGECRVVCQRSVSEVVRTRRKAHRDPNWRVVPDNANNLNAKDAEFE